MLTTLIIATYNWHEALELVLLSILNQTKKPDDIIIADDGSTSSTKDLIKKYLPKFRGKLKHIWQEDKGFRKTKILNRAVLQAKGEYIIQIDGDIILHKNFIKDHVNIAEKQTFIHGSRVLLNKKTSSKTLSIRSINPNYLKIGNKNIFNAIRSTTLSVIFSRKSKNRKGTRGCNFSFWKEDFISINGYNEDMIGWGKEDTELSVRLMNNNIVQYKLKFLAICFHLHHKKAKRKGLNINNYILEKAIHNKKTKCINGIKKY